MTDLKWMSMLLGVATGLQVAALWFLVRLLRRLDGPAKGHAHQMLCVGVQQAEVKTSSESGPLGFPVPAAGGDVTYCLMRCADCGDVASYTLRGHWTLDQVQGRTAADVADALMKSGKP